MSLESDLLSGVSGAKDKVTHTVMAGKLDPINLQAHILYYQFLEGMEAFIREQAEANSERE